MGLEFQIQEDKVCYTPLKDKYDAIQQRLFSNSISIGLSGKF